MQDTHFPDKKPEQTYDIEKAVGEVKGLLFSPPYSLCGCTVEEKLLLPEFMAISILDAFNQNSVASRWRVHETFPNTETEAYSRQSIYVPTPKRGEEYDKELLDLREEKVFQKALETALEPVIQASDIFTKQLNRNKEFVKDAFSSFAVENLPDYTHHNGYSILGMIRILSVHCGLTQPEQISERMRHYANQRSSTPTPTRDTGSDALLSWGLNGIKKINAQNISSKGSRFYTSLAIALCRNYTAILQPDIPTQIIGELLPVLSAIEPGDNTTEFLVEENTRFLKRLQGEAKLVKDFPEVYDLERRLREDKFLVMGI